MTSVNFFDINNQKRKTDDQYNILSGQTSKVNEAVNLNKYTKEMADLDNELTNEGLIIEKLSDQQKWDYVNSLTEKEYQRLSQYRDAGYSFGSAKALVDLERQRNNPTGVGGYRGVGFQMTEPVGGKDSAWNWSNPGAIFEYLDDRVQQTVIPKMTVTEQEKREKELINKYNSMTQEDWDKLYEEYINDPEAKHFSDDTLQENLNYYWEQKNKTAKDKLWSVELNYKEDENGNKRAEPLKANPSPLETIANAPASALGNASAVVRGITNPLDNLKMLWNLLATEEGRGMLADRYLSEEGRAESFEKDPVGWVLDIFDLGSLGLNVAGKTTRLGGAGLRLAGATDTGKTVSKRGDNMIKTADTMENIADMGISKGYDKILDKALGKLSEGGKVSNVIGDYISFTQRPLQTIWNGANPRNEKGEQVYQNGAWTIEGLQKPREKVLKGIQERIQNQATGLTPEVRERIRQNPFIREYRERIEAMLNEEGAPMDNQRILEGPIEEVGQELLRRLDEYEAKLEENGKEYQALRGTTRQYNLSDFLAGVYEVFEKNGITINADDELTFKTTANPADMNPVNTAWYVIKNMMPNLQNMTIAEFLDFRKQLRSLINYESDARSTRFSKAIIRQIVDGALNKLAHKEIPGLEKVDEIYHKQINELKEFKDGLVYQQGEKRGQIKDNFYSIISTMNTQNRQKMKERLERIYPDLGARIEAIRMLPILAKTYQNSPKLVNNMLKTLSALTGVKYSQGPVELAISWILGIIADELISKPLGEKRRKREIAELLSEMSPEAKQKLAEIKSKIDAGTELSEQEKKDLALAMQEVAMAEYEYLDEQHKKEFDKIMQSANNTQPKLPAPGMDVINPDGTITLGMGNQLNSPESYKPKTREERVQEAIQEEGVDTDTAEEMTNSVEDFLDEIGGDINGNIDTRNVNYEKFSTKNLNELMNDDSIPYSEKEKINKVLLSREGVENAPESRENLDQEFAWRIRQLQEEEQRVGKVGKNKVNRAEAQKQQNAVDDKRDALKREMRERYAGQGEALDQERAEEKYRELAGKPTDYINNYKKSKNYRTDRAEKKVLDQLREVWSKQPKFIREMDDTTANKRQDIVSNELQNGYEWETTDYNDRFVNKQTGDKGIIKYKPDGTIEVTISQNGYDNSGIMDILPGDADVRFINDKGDIEEETIKAGILRGDEYQTVGRANPDERDMTAEEGLGIMSFKGDKTIGELADEYGLKKKIVEKIFTAEGEEALGRARGDLIELVKEIKEGTAPHEVFHPIFNMVNKKRRQEIIDLVRKNKGMTESEAKERLADSFSEYFRTGKFDTKPIPKGFINKVKWFFNQVREFINGTWRSRKKIQKLFDDIMENKIERGEIESNEWEYQLQQKSLFEADDPLNGYKSSDYAKLSDDISALYDIAHPIARDNNYSWDAFLNQLGLTYSPDLEIWRDRLNEEGIKIDNEKLVRVYNGIRKIMNEPRSEFVLKRQTSNTVMNAINKITEKMKIDPLDIPMEYGEMNNALKQQDWSPLERYLEKHPQNINALWKTYDPDVIEWRDNLEKKFTGGGYISLTELYEIKNMLDDYIKTYPEDAKIEGTIDDVGIKFLVDKARYREENHGKIGSYDKNQIEKIGLETNDLLSNRIGDFKQRIKREASRSDDADYRDKMDEMWYDFQPEFIYELGKTYDPNVDKWQKNISKKIVELRDRYKELFVASDSKVIKNIVKPHQLNSLKAKINELEKYSYEDIFEAFEGQEAELFFRAVKPRIDELKAKGVEKAVTNLVAISNLDEGNFKKLVENFNGKDPMPSIAVMDVNVPHEVFGDISLVFGRDTVDPKVDERNVIYGSDAWTPTFPRIKEIGGMSYDNVRKFASDTVDNMIDKGVELTPEEAGYLSKDIGNIILEFDGRSDLKTNADHLAEQVIEDLAEGGYEDFIENNEGAVTELEWKIENFLQSVNNDRRQMIPAEYFLGEKKYYTNADYVAEELVDYVSDEVRGYYDEGDNRLLIRDIAKTLNKMHDFQSDLLEDLGSEFGIEDSDRVRTLLDTLKMVEQGDRPLTPENVLTAMRNQRVNRENVPGSYRDMIEIEGAKLNDIEDVRRQNFAKVFHGDWTGDLGELEKKYDRLLYTVAKDIMGYDDTEIIQSQNMLRQEIKRSYDKDADTFKKNLVEENEIWDAVPDELLQRIIDVVEQGKRVPIRFSESKPERIVNLMEEVRYILAPEGADASQVKSIVKGTPLEDKVVEYKPDNNSAPRSKKLKELQKKYGNVFFSMGGVIMPIAMLLLMMQGEDEGQA